LPGFGETMEPCKSEPCDGCAARRIVARVLEQGPGPEPGPWDFESHKEQRQQGMTRRSRCNGIAAAAAAVVVAADYDHDQEDHEYEHDQDQDHMADLVYNPREVPTVVTQLPSCSYRMVQVETLCLLVPYLIGSERYAGDCRGTVAAAGAVKTKTRLDG
jgi:hypothetical protein